MKQTIKCNKEKNYEIAWEYFERFAPADLFGQAAGVIRTVLK